MKAPTHETSAVIERVTVTPPPSQRRGGPAVTNDRARTSRSVVGARFECRGAEQRPRRARRAARRPRAGPDGDGDWRKIVRPRLAFVGSAAGAVGARHRRAPRLPAGLPARRHWWRGPRASRARPSSSTRGAAGSSIATAACSPTASTATSSTPCRATSSDPEALATSAVRRARRLRRRGTQGARAAAATAVATGRRSSSTLSPEEADGIASLEAGRLRRRPRQGRPHRLADDPDARAQGHRRLSPAASAASSRAAATTRARRSRSACRARRISSTSASARRRPRRSASPR